jgi:hypothetical protein
MRLKHLPLVALYVLAVWLTFDSLRTFVHEFPVRDFGSFYLSAHDFWQTGVLYAERPFINLNAPHVSVILFTPFLLLNLPAAAAVWFAVGMILVAISVVIIRSELQLSRTRVASLVAVILASSAMQHSWRQGQLGPVLLLLGTLSWRAARRGNVATSWWIAAGASLKPWMVIWIATQNRRAAIRTLVIGAAGVAVGIALIGLPNWIGWKAAIDAHTLWPYPSNVSIFAVWLRSGAQDRAFFTGLCVTVVIVRTWLARGGSVDRMWLLWSLVGLLSSPIAWTYYLLTLAGPLMAWGEEERWPAATMAALGIFLIPAAFVSGSIYTLGVVLLWASVCRNWTQPLTAPAPPTVPRTTPLIVT